MLTQDRLHELLHYNPGTGDFIWNVSRGKAKADMIAGTTRPNGYLQIRIDGANYLGHRLAWFYMMGEWPPYEIDHINGNPLDNRWENLRLATREQNARNCGRKMSKTGVRGVYLEPRTGKFYVQLRNGRGNRTCLGTFDHLYEAKEARENAAAVHHGEFARFD